MKLFAGIDVGSTYTKAVVLDEDDQIVGRALRPTGFRLGHAAEQALEEALMACGGTTDDVAYQVATGFGRHRVKAADASVTDLTAASRGTRRLFPGTQTVLDIGGQTVKASRLDDAGKVHAFRLNDKCAAGTGAFLEKSARYMGYETEEIGALAATSKEAVPISGVCAVFAESEVINHLSQGCSPADIMRGAMVSLVERSLQLLKRVKMEPEYTLIGGILRYPSMVVELKRRIESDAVNVPGEDLSQYCNALGAAVLATRREKKLQES
jgi:predicted CoA-substrate-specific enzyme activase